MNSREATCSTLEALEAAGLPYMLTGGLVQNTFGIVRSTHDADIVVQIEAGDFNSFVRALPSDLSVDPQISFETITGSRRHIIELRGSAFRIEIFFLSGDAHHQLRFQRRCWKFVPDLQREAWIATAEDLIVQKVRWARLKDLDDAFSVLGVQGDTLDFAYIERWCREHGTLDRLEDLRRKIPPI